MFPERIVHNYNQAKHALPDWIIAKRGIFAIGLKEDLIAVYVDDDGVYLLRMVVHKHWTEQLCLLLLEAKLWL